VQTRNILIFRERSHNSFSLTPFVPACCCITPDFLADSRLPVHFALAESP
jgi:hypothetical protein